MDKNNWSEFAKGFWDENPVLRLMLGLCPTLAVTTSAINGLGMGIAASFVLLSSNIVISLIRDLIPEKVRIPSYIVVIASFVTLTDLTMHAFSPALHEALGIFVPLIVVNCIILGRVEAFASRNNVSSSILDGLGMAGGFTLTLMVLGGIRELLGTGAIFGYPVLTIATDNAFQPAIVMILPPGAFLALGLMMGGMNRIAQRTRRAS